MILIREMGIWCKGWLVVGVVMCGIKTSHLLCDQAFNELKEALISTPILGFLDNSLPFILEVDSSFTGYGAVLSQT